MSGSSPWVKDKAAPVFTLVERVKAGDVKAVSRLITLLESEDSEWVAISSGLGPSTGHATIIGITGYPGVGKSTLIDRLTEAYRAQGKKLGIIAVDTSSPLTGGAILGDRIRMQSHSLDEHVYIRSMATRGHRGGLARATGGAIHVLEAAGYDVILIETIGVGQEEGEIVKLAQTVVVVVAPGLGDEVQAMKAGLLELAHLVVVNKADRQDANLTIQTFQDWVPKILPTVALKGEGIQAVMEAIATHRRAMTAEPSDFV